MYISRLKDIVDTYDRFCIHRINGLKAFFVLELMFLFHFIYTVPNPYFYYFYVPLTAFAAELAGNSLEEKSLFLFLTLTSCTIVIFLFDIASEYKTFFVFFVFFVSLFLYYIAVYKLKGFFVAAPLILSLGAYSLIYGDTNTNFYIALNNALETLVAMLIMLLGLYVFPKSYYLIIWRRAFYDVLVNLEQITAKICKEDVKTIQIVSGIIVMERHSKMLSKKMKYYSILKITILSFDLIMAMSYLISFQKTVNIHYVVVLNKYIKLLRDACLKQQPIEIEPHEVAVMDETHELRTLNQIILSWNHLCLDQW